MTDTRRRVRLIIRYTRVIEQDETNELEERRRHFFIDKDTSNRLGENDRSEMFRGTHLFPVIVLFRRLLTNEHSLCSYSQEYNLKVNVTTLDTNEYDSMKFK